MLVTKHVLFVFCESLRERRERVSEQAMTAAMAGTAKTVKDVASHDFVRAYAAHLKRSGKVSQYLCCSFSIRSIDPKEVGFSKFLC